MAEPPIPVLTAHKTTAPPFDIASRINIEDIYDNPELIGDVIDEDFVSNLKLAKFTPEIVTKTDPDKVCRMLQVFQLMFECVESDQNWYMDTLKNEASGHRRVTEDTQVLQALNDDLQVRLQERSDRIAELQRELDKKKDLQKNFEVCSQRVFQLQADLERHKSQNEEYRKSVEQKLKRAAEVEARTRKDTREGERDVRALQQMIQQTEDELRKSDRLLRSSKASEQTLLFRLEEMENKERALRVMLDDLNDSNENLRFRLEEKEDQCLSLEKHAVEDLQAIRDKTSKSAVDNERVTHKHKQELQQITASLALQKEENFNLQKKVSETHQIMDDMAEKAASKDTECKHLRHQLDKLEKVRVSQQSFPLPLTTPDLSGIKGSSEEFYQLAELLKQRTRDLALEQARRQDDERERNRLDRDVVELRKQLDIYERSGVEGAVAEKRARIAEMQQCLDERDNALIEMRDKLNQADEDLDNLLEFTEALKQLALECGLTREQIMSLSTMKVPHTERKSTEVEELREKLYVRDREIEILERERLHWKKQVRLQALPRFEQAQKMGITPEQLSMLADIRDRMRESDSTDIQALVGEGEDYNLIVGTSRAALERQNKSLSDKVTSLRAELAKFEGKYEVLKEHYHRLHLNQDKFQQQINISKDPAGSIWHTSGMLTDKKSSSASGNTSESGDENSKEKKKKTSIAPDSSPMFPPLPQNLMQQLANAQLNDGRVQQMLGDYNKTNTVLGELRKELQRTNDSLENAERRAKGYLEERDAFRRTLAYRDGFKQKTPTESDQMLPATSEPEKSEPQAEGHNELWDTDPEQAAALSPKAAATEIEAALHQEIANKENALRTLMVAYDKKESDIVEGEKIKNEAIDRMADMKDKFENEQFEGVRLKADLEYLRECLSDTESLLQEERTKLEEHQEYIAGLQGKSDDPTLREAGTEVMRKVTALRVNEIRLIKRYKMSMAESDTSRERLRESEKSLIALQKETGEQIASLLGQLKESEGVQKVLHDRLEFTEKTRNFESLRIQLGTAKQELQTYLSIERDDNNAKHQYAELKKEAEALKRDIGEITIERTSVKEELQRTKRLLEQGATDGNSLREREKIVELDMEVKTANQKVDLNRNRAQAAVREAGVLESEKLEMSGEIVSLRQKQAKLLSELREAQESLQDSVALSEMQQLQSKINDLETVKNKAEARSIRAIETSQATVEYSLTIEQVHNQYKEELETLRRVIAGLEPANDEGYVLGEMQYRTFQQQIQNIALKKEKEQAELSLVSKKARTQAIHVQNTQLLNELAKVYDEYIQKSHELHQSNVTLKGELDGRLSPEDSSKLNKQLETERRNVEDSNKSLRDAKKKISELEFREDESQKIQDAIRLLDTRDMSKIEIEYKKTVQDLSATKLQSLKTEWQGRELSEEVVMLRKLKTASQEQMEFLQKETVELQQQRDASNNEFTRKVEELYQKLKESKVREAATMKQSIRDRESNNSSIMAPQVKDNEEHISILNNKIKEMRSSETAQNNNNSELRNKVGKLTADIHNLKSDLEKRNVINAALQKEVMDERLKSRQTVDRIREVETSRGEALQEVARRNTATLQELLRKKDDALKRVTDQLNNDRQVYAAEKQISNIKISDLHKQLHKENSDTIRKFSDRLNSISSAPPMRAEDNEPVPGSLIDIKMAQMTAELSRQQGKLDLAEAEIRKLTRELSERDLADKTKEQVVITSPEKQIGAQWSVDEVQKLQQQIQTLTEQLQKERDMHREKELEQSAIDEAEKYQKVNQSDQIQQTELFQATIVKAKKKGVRVLCTREITFRSGKKLQVGDAGVISREVSDEDSSKMEIIWDNGIVFDATDADIEVAPQPAFTVHSETPIDTINLIILERETLIRQQALQIDDFERQLLKCSRDRSEAVDSERLAHKKRREAEEINERLQLELGDKASAALQSQITKLEGHVRNLEADKKSLEGEVRTTHEALKSTKSELAIRYKIESQNSRRDKVDEELRTRFEEVQKESDKNIQSLQYRIKAIKSDFEGVLSREETLLKEVENEKKRTAALESSLSVAEKLNESTQKQSKEAWVGANSSFEAKGFEQQASIPTLNEELLKRENDKLNRTVDELEIQNRVHRLKEKSNLSRPQQQQTSPLRTSLDNKSELYELRQERAEWTAIKSALIHKLREAQEDTEKRERSIKRQLDNCRFATERRISDIKKEAEIAMADTETSNGRVESLKRELENVRSELLQSTNAVGNLQTDLTKAESLLQSLRQKQSATSSEAPQRRVVQRTKKPPREALCHIGVNTMPVPLTSSSPQDDAPDKELMSYRGISPKKRTTATIPKPGSSNEVMKYWEENKKLKRIINNLKQTQRQKSTMIPLAEHDKVKGELIKVQEELRFTREKLAVKQEELHQRAVDMHTFEKVNSFKNEIMRLEDENMRLKRSIEIESEIEIRNLQHALRRKDEQIQQMEALYTKNDEIRIDVQLTEHVPSVPHSVINQLIIDNPTITDRLESLRQMFKSTEDRLLESTNEILQLRFAKEAAIAQQQRAERHLKDLQSIVPTNMESTGAAIMGNLKLSKDRQIHDFQQVIAGMKTVIERLKTDKETLERNGISNMKYVEIMKENKNLKAKLSATKTAEKEVKQQQETHQPQSTTESTLLKKKLKREQEISSKLRDDLSLLTAAFQEEQTKRLQPSESTQAMQRLEEANNQMAEDALLGEKLRSEVTILRNDIEGWRQRCESAQLENQILTKRNTKLEADLSLFDVEFLEEVANLQKQNADLQKVNKQLEEKLVVQSVFDPLSEEPSRGLAGIRKRQSTLRDSIDSTSSSINDSRIAAAIRSLQQPVSTSLDTDGVPATSSASTSLDLSNYTRSRLTGGRYSS